MTARLRDNAQLLKVVRAYRLKSASSRDPKKDLDLLVAKEEKEGCLSLLERFGAKRFLDIRGGDAKTLVPLVEKPYFRIVHLNVNTSSTSSFRKAWRLLGYWKGSTTIVLIGVDGSGKSTISRALEETLAPYFPTVKLYFGWDQFLLPIFKVTKKASEKRLQAAKRNGGPASPEKTGWLHLSVYYVELLLRYWFRVLPRKMLGRTLILDRYFYDKLIHLDPRSSKFKVFKALTPTPDITFLLLNRPHVTFRRKEEKRPEEIRRLQRLYVEKGVVFSVKIIKNEGSVGETVRRIVSIVGPELMRKKQVLA